MLPAWVTFTVDWGQLMRRLLGSALVAGLCVTAIACSDPSTRPDGRVTTLRVTNSPVTPGTIRQQFLELARRNRGFAGVYRDSAGRLTVNVATDDFDSGRVANVMRWVRDFTGGSELGAPRINRVRRTSF